MKEYILIIISIVIITLCMLLGFYTGRKSNYEIKEDMIEKIKMEGYQEGLNDINCPCYFNADTLIIRKEYKEVE